MFTPSTYGNFVNARSPAQERLVLQYIGPRNDFDLVIVGSGIGGGILADALAERNGARKRILLLEAGSFLYPTHVYNFCRFDNAKLARHFGCDTFWQSGSPDTERFIGEKPQLNFGGRSIFWSGLIPTIQGWELAFFPERVQRDLQGGGLDAAGTTMNESRSLGTTAEAIVDALRATDLGEHFHIEETPRAVHQPYLEADGTPKEEFFTEPTGVFNTAELITNQLGLTPGVSHGDHEGLHLLLNHFVEDVQKHGDHYHVVCRNTLEGTIRTFDAPRVVLACGSIETPKLVRRSSSLFAALPPSVQGLVGRGLTDHPTSEEMTAYVTHIGGTPIPTSTHAKVIFYSRGVPEVAGNERSPIRFPFNVEMNINHEYWHLRENDPNDPNRHDPDAFRTNDPNGASRVDIKFSFGNCLDDGNEVRPAPAFGYVPEVWFRNLSRIEDLSGERFPHLAGWSRSKEEVFELLNDLTRRIFARFERDGAPAEPQEDARFGEGGKGFGWGTVHHAAGTMRMPYRPSYHDDFAEASVVDEDLEVIGMEGLFVCDMSVMPFSSAANPVRTLAALALRLADHLERRG